MWHYLFHGCKEEYYSFSLLWFKEVKILFRISWYLWEGKKREKTRIYIPSLGIQTSGPFITSMLEGWCLQPLWGQWRKRGASGSEGSLLWVSVAALQAIAPSLPSKDTEAWENNLLSQAPPVPQPPVLHRSEHRNCDMCLGDPVLNKADGYFKLSNLPRCFSHASSDWLWGGISLTSLAMAEHQSCHWITVPAICRSPHKHFLKTSPRLELLQERVLCFHFNSIWSTGQEMGKTRQYSTPHNSNYEGLLIFTKLFKLAYLLDVALGTHLQKCQFMKASMYISSSELSTLVDTIILLNSWGLNLGQTNFITKVPFSFCSQWLTSVQRTIF